MPRNISFALTTQQFKARTKTVTRRMGWLNLRDGEVLNGVKKAMGLRPGEQIERLGEIVVVNVRREPLRRMTDEPEYGRAETDAEGFPQMTPERFVEFFCASHKKCTPDSTVTRIEYAYRGRKCCDECPGDNTCEHAKWCMCGSSADHSPWEGHSPVSMHDYYCDQITDGQSAEENSK